MAVAVRYRGSVIYRKGFGLSDLENRVATAPDTAFPVGSISKSFTALAVMQLVAKGRLSLDSTLGSYLPEYRGPARDVQLRHLLNHTSGLANYTSLPAFPDPQVHLSHEQVIAYVQHLPLMFAAGSRFSYSNTNLYLLGIIVERVTGQKLATYLRSNVFEPFGMEHTYFAGSSAVIPHRAHGYVFEADKYINAEQYDVDYPFAAGAVISTVDDLLRYQQGLFGGQKTPTRTRERMLELDRLANGTSVYYALGCLIVRDFEGHRKVSHSGVISGFSAHFAYYPDDDLTIAVLTNLEHGSIPPYAIERKLARNFLGLPQPALKDLPLSESELRRLVGDFEVGPFVFDVARLGFFADGGHLSVRPGGVSGKGPSIALRNQGAGKFVTSEDDEFTFTFSGEQPALSVTAEYFDGTFPAVRQVKR